MNKQCVLGTISFFVFIIAVGKPFAEDANPFTRLPGEGVASKDISVVFSKAEKLYAWLTGEARRGDFPVGGLHPQVIDPFMSKLPEGPDPVRESEKNLKPGGLPQPTQEDVPDKPLPEGVETAKVIPPFKLMGYVWGTERPQAILNGMVVDVGDEVDGWTVLDISKRGILIESHDKKQHFIEP